jgi:hypothetical protein
MIQGPPPALAELAKFDREWNGTPHRNICVRIANGSATIKVSGAPDYVVYYVPKIYTFFSEVPGRITIETPDDPRFNGLACLGIEQ